MSERSCRKWARELQFGGGYRWYHEITFLKGISIFTIVLMHLIQTNISMTPNFIKTAASLGGTGVHIFFFCSGFGLYLSYLRHETGYLEFLKKRFLKVYVPYIIVVVISFCIPLIDVKGNRIVALLSHAFLFKMFSPTYDESFGHFWFISTLFQFYLLFIPLCRIKEKVRTNAFLRLCVGMSGLWWILTGATGLNGIRPIGSFFLQYLWEFAIGMIVAERLFRGKDIEFENWKLCIAAVIGIGLEGVLAMSAGFLKAFNDIPALIGYGALGLLMFQIKPIRKAGDWIGSISYELYLVHMGIFMIAFNLFAPDTLRTQLFIGIACFSVSIIVAYCYHKGSMAGSRKES